MLVMTVDGQIGAGGPEVGAIIARSLGLKYVEQLALKRTAARLSASLEAVALKEQHFGSWKDRLRDFLNLWILQSGRYGDAFDPMTIPLMWRDPYADLPHTGYTDDRRRAARFSPADITDHEFTSAVRDVSKGFADEGNVILVKRGGCLTLREEPGAIHVGLFAPREARVRRVAQRFGVGLTEGESVLDRLEKARRGYFRQLGGDDPYATELYGLTLDTGPEPDDETTARKIVTAVRAA